MTANQQGTRFERVIPLGGEAIGFDRGGRGDRAGAARTRHSEPAACAHRGARPRRGTCDRLPHDRGDAMDVGEGRGMSRRPYGAGTLYVKAGSWYGRWRIAGRRVNRRLGPVRKPGTREGLTRPQAERELRRWMEQEHAMATMTARLTVAEAGERLDRPPGGARPQALDVEDYGSTLRVHLAPFFGDRPLDRIAREDVEAFMAANAPRGRGTEEHAQLPRPAALDLRLRRAARLGALEPVQARRQAAGDAGRRRHPLPRRRRARGAARAPCPTTPLGPTERVLYLTAAMTGTAPGRAARAALARHRLDGAPGPGAAQLRARRVRHAQVEALEPRGAARRPARRRARAPLPALRLPGRRRPGLRAPAHGRAARPLASCSSASRRRCRRAGRAARSASTTCATPSARAWPPPASRCARCRSGWATATSRRR